MRCIRQHKGASYPLKSLVTTNQGWNQCKTLKYTFCLTLNTFMYFSCVSSVSCLFSTSKCESSLTPLTTPSTPEFGTNGLWWCFLCDWVGVWPPGTCISPCCMQAAVWGNMLSQLCGYWSFSLDPNCQHCFHTGLLVMIHSALSHLPNLFGGLLMVIWLVRLKLMQPCSKSSLHYCSSFI